MTELGRYTQRFNDWRRAISAVPLTARTKLFMEAADDLARLTTNGLSKQDVVDELHDIAQAYDLEKNESDVDAVQWVLSRAFEKVEEIERVPDIEPERSYTNGKAANDADVEPIPLAFPFPIDATKLPFRPWIVPGLLLRKQVTMMVAPAGSGKSLLTLQLAMLCTSGLEEWNGWRPRGKFRVLIINAEEDSDEMSRRLWAAQKRMQLEQADLSGLALAKEPDTIVVAKADPRTKTVIRTPMLERIVHTIRQGSYDVVIVDPFAETFAGDENSNSELKWAGMLWREVARTTNTSVMLIHHTRKYAQEMAGNADAGRGAGALVGVARIVSTLFTMTEKEADQFKKSRSERIRYIRYDDAKANLTLMTLNARWFEKVSEQLPNGNGTIEGDEVGVLIPWQPPSDVLTQQEIVDVFDELAKGAVDPQTNQRSGDPYGVPKKAKERWAGLLILKIRPAWYDDRVRKVLTDWIEIGAIEEYKATTSTSKGKLRDCLRVVDVSKATGTIIDA